ncbi:MAG: orotate phosphoribosyltransferase [Paludibacteraceae bacterium]|jgi:orotate phosphoribosyltransferase|nr:orotate phosphoribosyltransferase [Paludibacteraceae bacterium]MBQ6766229.1 orotate phosphoribosyltransferase [Paludibacteraceae bacterium]MDY6373901.1 orotate phosphoribosyltransferase [Bacteroidales bacterium]MDY6427329.1 orotate phosphoribosyltransferase [Bacteroidales bacterium]
MNTVQSLVAGKLLEIKAVKLQPEKPFTWASGWKSPIYCDNRKTLSYPEVRSLIKVELARIVMEKYPDADAIAGVATGAIAQGALVADLLGLPFVYIRSSKKDHGMENLVEGYIEEGRKVVVIEDLISTGGSSLKAVQAIRDEKKCEVLGMVAIFTYGFPLAEEQFRNANVELTTLSNYEAVIEKALQINYIPESALPTLKEWRKDPSHWNA